MKRLILSAAVVGMFAMAALAQTPDGAKMDKLKLEMERMVAQSKVIGVAGSVMGSTVKGAPYSAVEVTESNQMLADGTRIHNESQTKVYRDGEGRVRRETPDQITIMDPVAGTTYLLDPKNQTVRKISLTSGSMVFKRSVVGAGGAGVSAGAAAGGLSTTFEVRSNNGVTSVVIDGKPVDAATMAQMKARGELEMDAATAEVVAIPRLHVQGGPPAADTMTYQRIQKLGGQAESLGRQTFEGVASEGTRTTSTVAAGTIGNDRPIQSVSERWYSPELQTVMMSKHSDPRSGEDSFRLTNVIRGEPSPDLFQVPPTYHTQDRM